MENERADAAGRNSRPKLARPDLQAALTGAGEPPPVPMFQTTRSVIIAKHNKNNILC